MNFGTEIILDQGWLDTGVTLLVFIAIATLIYIGCLRGDRNDYKRQRDDAVERVVKNRQAFKALDRLDPSIAKAFEYAPKPSNPWYGERDDSWLYKETAGPISVGKLSELWPDLKAEKLAHESEARVAQAKKKLDKARSK